MIGYGWLTFWLLLFSGFGGWIGWNAHVLLIEHCENKDAESTGGQP